MWISNLKLKYQLILIVVASLITMIITQVVYYHFSGEIIKKNMFNHFYSMTTQIEENILSSVVDIERTAFIISISQNVQQYIYADNDADKFSILQYVKDNLNFGVVSNNYILSARLIEQGGRLIKSQKSDDTVVFNKMNVDYNFEGTLYNTAFFTNCYRDDKSNQVYYAYIYPVYNVTKGKYESNNSAMLVLLCGTNKFANIIANISESLECSFLLMDDNEIIVTNLEKQSKKTDSFLNEIKKLGEGRFEINIEGKECIGQKSFDASTGWGIVFFIPTEKLLEDVSTIWYIGFIIIGIAAFILTLSSAILIRSISKPISSIIKGMREIKYNDVKYRLKKPCNNEIGTLAEDINAMLERLDSTTQHILQTQTALYEAELTKKQAELSFLQSQVNPHFLYNTLECIRSIALVNNVTEIVKIATAMGKLFRYCVSKDYIVPLESELKCIKDYFDIVSIRYPDRFILKESIDPDLLKARIIKMILQPIVENSVKHGFKGKKDGGVISIKGYLGDSSDIIIDITDNGIGFEQDELNLINEILQHYDAPQDKINASKSGIGLANINARLKLNYGDRYGLNITSTPNTCTTVKIIIPFLT